MSCGLRAVKARDPGLSTLRGRMAQLVRAPALHAGGHRFESCFAHHRGRPVRSGLQWELLTERLLRSRRSAV